MKKVLARGAGVVAVVALAGCADEEVVAFGSGESGVGWAQWGQDARHHGRMNVVGQRPSALLGEVVLDPFIEQEIAEVSEGDEERALLVHYQAPLVAGDQVFVSKKGGSFTACDPPGSGEPAPCGVDAWGSMTWSEERWTWRGGALARDWSFTTDWKPPPNGAGPRGWEPVFHAALAGPWLVVPGAGGSIWPVDRYSGRVAPRIDPFDGEAPDRTFVAGPLTVAKTGDIYYHALRLAELPPPTGADDDPETAWDLDVEGAWLVHVRPDGTSERVSFTDLLGVEAPAPDDACVTSFRAADLPWPPSADAPARTVLCGSQRPGLNVAPAVGDDGTIVTVSRAHFSARAAFVVALQPDLTPKWIASLADHLSDGCGTAKMPPAGQPGACREGAALGVDPATNEPPAGAVVDSSTASPVITPDGGVLYGAYTRYNFARGHLFSFSPLGGFRGSYDFGWDVTPAIYERDDTYSIVLKENNYDTGSYCSDEDWCPPREEGPFYITQLSADLNVEWQFQLTNTKSCKRQPDGTLDCVDDHPTGFEWCINAPAVDDAGTVFANGEDGVLYAIPQGGGEAATFFLGEALGAAYTPLSLDDQGRVYTQNVGRLFVVGE